MEYAIVSVPAAPVRLKPNHRKEMVNQLLFGEVVKILKTKENGKWLKAESLYDGYRGWLTHHLVTEVDEATALSKDCVLCTDLINEIRVGDQTYQLPVAARLPGMKAAKGKFAAFEYSFKGNSIKDFKAPDPGIIKTNAFKFLNAPYQWGGKTIFGIDCSGFAQTVFKLSGIKISRDAWQQAQQGNKVGGLEKAQCGDLAFFDDKDEIVHVGILLGSDKIIHAAGRVHIDDIDKKGITNVETGIRTHKLHTRKRFI